MKLKYKFVTNKVADKIVAVAVGEDLKKFGGFIKMNGTGAVIFSMLKNDVTENEIFTALKKEYPDATDEEIRESVNDFTFQLKESGVIE